MAGSYRVIDLQGRVTEIENKLRFARLLRTLFRLGFVVGPASLGLTWILFSVDLPTPIKMLAWITIPLCIASAIYAFAYFVGIYLGEEQKTVHQWEVELSAARDQKALAIKSDAEAARVRRLFYLERIADDISVYRGDSRRYRRVHNVFQGAIIVGSLTTTTLASLSVLQTSMRWLTVGVSFVVGLSAGFTGYFKYRERSFYLQQTADSLEAEWNAFELGVRQYANLKAEPAISLFIETAEQLKGEQRKREQSLDQSADPQQVPRASA